MQPPPPAYHMMLHPATHPWRPVYLWLTHPYTFPHFQAPAMLFGLNVEKLRGHGCMEASLWLFFCCCFACKQWAHGCMMHGWMCERQCGFTPLFPSAHPSQSPPLHIFLTPPAGAHRRQAELRANSVHELHISHTFPCTSLTPRFQVHIVVGLSSGQSTTLWRSHATTAASGCE